MSPLEFMQRLAALVPRPRLHLIRFHGVLAANARLRPEVIPNVPVNVNTPSADHAKAPPPAAPARLAEPGCSQNRRERVLNGECRPAGRKPWTAFVNGYSISTWNAAPSVVAP
jgi:hypothetical protein